MDLEASDAFEEDVVFGIQFSDALRAMQVSIGRIGSTPYSVVLDEMTVRKVSMQIASFLACLKP